MVQAKKEDRRAQLERAVLAKYGLTLTVTDVSELLHVKPRSIHAALSDERFPIRPLRRGKPLLFLATDVASHLAEGA